MLYNFAGISAEGIGYAAIVLLSAILWFVRRSWRLYVRHLLIIAVLILYIISAPNIYLFIKELLYLAGAPNYERFVIMNRAFGPYWFAYWAIVLCSYVFPNLLWFKRLRRKDIMVWAIATSELLAKTLSPLVSLFSFMHRDFLPSSWTMYSPLSWDRLLYAFIYAAVIVGVSFFSYRGKSLFNKA